MNGEILALDDSGRSNFNLLQHAHSQASCIHYFVFDPLLYDLKNKGFPGSPGLQVSEYTAKGTKMNLL